MTFLTFSKEIELIFGENKENKKLNKSVLLKIFTNFLFLEFLDNS